MWVRKRQIPPLVSRGSLGDPIPGALGEPGSFAFLGPGSADTPFQNGGRVSALLWFDRCQTCGIDGSFYGLEQVTHVLAAGSPGNDGSLLLSRPFFNANTNTQDADPIAIPNVMGGALVVSMPRQFFGGDFDFRFAHDVYCLVPSHLSLLAGGRFLSLTEKLNISEGVVEHSEEAQGAFGNVYAINDYFSTYNRFYGGQVGVATDTDFGPVTLTINVKVAGGETLQTVKTEGSTLVFEPATRTLSYDPSRGLLVQPTNLGRFKRTAFGLVPEATVRVGWAFNSHLQAWVGYNFLYWSDVLRPGDQIDTTVNLQPVNATNFNTGPHRPAILLNPTSFWVQGLTFGVQVSY
jgi:hypothetical protein